MRTPAAVVAALLASRDAQVARLQLVRRLGEQALDRAPVHLGRRGLPIGCPVSSGHHFSPSRDRSRRRRAVVPPAFSTLTKGCSLARRPPRCASRKTTASSTVRSCDVRTGAACSRSVGRPRAGRRRTEPTRADNCCTRTPHAPRTWPGSHRRQAAAGPRSRPAGGPGWHVLCRAKASSAGPGVNASSPAGPGLAGRRAFAVSAMTGTDGRRAQMAAAADGRGMPPGVRRCRLVLACPAPRAASSASAACADDARPKARHRGGPSHVHARGDLLHASTRNHE